MDSVSRAKHSFHKTTAPCPKANFKHLSPSAIDEMRQLIDQTLEHGTDLIKLLRVKLQENVASLQVNVASLQVNVASLQVNVASLQMIVVSLQLGVGRRL